MPSVDTIAAIATAAGRGGIGIVRLSGPAVPAILSGITHSPLAPRQAGLRQFVDDIGAIIDQGIALHFPQPHSYTGEDVLELHGHGGPAVLQQLLLRCLQLGARLAEPGEFTRRAFLNGKLDLAQAEAVADLIDASTSRAARSAMRSLQGEFSARTNALRDALIETRALIEASLDFPDDNLVVDDTALHLGLLEHGFNDLLKASVNGRLLRDGIEVALIGRPNVGKSSLLNRLAGDDVAIVTDVPGTTRDLVRQSIQIDGVPIHMVDTAGLHESKEKVEQIGISRARTAAACADIVLAVVDARTGARGVAEVVAEIPQGGVYLTVVNKIDLVAGISSGVSADPLTVHVSAKTGAGLPLLCDSILRAAGWNSEDEGLFAARARHVDALGEASRHIEQAMRSKGEAELVAEELRLAQRALSRITGEYAADELLGEIFSRFCIGK